MKKNLWFFLFSLIGFSGCIQDLDDWLKTSDINFNRKADTKYFSKDYASFDVNRIKNDLKINFYWQTPDDFPFPVDKNAVDTLTVTSFSYCFKDNGKVIPVKEITHYRNSVYNWELDSNNFIVTTPKQNLKHNFSEQLVIPLYYFYNLKTGKHQITVDIYQTKFSLSSDNNYDSSGNLISEVNSSLIRGSIFFTLNIPLISRTDIYTDGIELKSDTGFTPAGMDFSLTTPGYPDIYWELFFPVASETDLANPYYISSVARASTERQERDTIKFFHYSISDKVIIGVYDQDVITRDDYLGDWFGSLKMFSSKRGEYKSISFDHVKKFAIKTEFLGAVNK